MFQFAIWLLGKLKKLRWNNAERCQFLREHDLGIGTIVVTRTMRVKLYNESIQHGYLICHIIVSYTQLIQYGYRMCCASSNGISIMYKLRCSTVQLDLTIIYQLTHITCYMAPDCTTDLDSSTTTIPNDMSLQYKVAASAIQQAYNTTMSSLTIWKEVHKIHIMNISDTSAAQ